MYGGFSPLTVIPNVPLQIDGSQEELSDEKVESIDKKEGSEIVILRGITSEQFKSIIWIT